jgi:hypothetical protein
MYSQSISPRPLQSGQIISMLVLGVPIAQTTPSPLHLRQIDDLNLVLLCAVFCDSMVSFYMDMVIVLIRSH